MDDHAGKWEQPDAPPGRRTAGVGQPGHAAQTATIQNGVLIASAASATPSVPKDSKTSLPGRIPDSEEPVEGGDVSVAGGSAGAGPPKDPEASRLGDHPKPASRDHLKTGQLQTRTQDKIVVPYL